MLCTEGRGGKEEREGSKESGMEKREKDREREERERERSGNTACTGAFDRPMN